MNQKPDIRYFWDAYAKLVAANLAARKRHKPAKTA